MGLDWLDKLEIGLQGGKKTNVIRHKDEDERRQRIVHECEDLFKNNQTIKDLTIDIQLKKDSKPMQQKKRPVPIHFQNTVQELEKLIWKGHLEKAHKTTEKCFIPPAGITIKKYKWVKIALVSRKLNEACVKRKTAMPNMEELISKLLTEITKSDGDIWMSKIDLDYAYGQAKLSKEAAKLCVFFDYRRRFHGTFPIQERVLRAVGYPHGIPRTHRHRTGI